RSAYSQPHARVFPESVLQKSPPPGFLHGRVGFSTGGDPPRSPWHPGDCWGRMPSISRAPAMKPPTKPYNFHPACLAFPLLADAELRELADDIKLRGLLQPVVVFRGQILDGRNRLAACEMAGGAPRFTEWPGGGSPGDWVI